MLSSSGSKRCGRTSALHSRPIARRTQVPLPLPTLLCTLPIFLCISCQLPSASLPRYCHPFPTECLGTAGGKSLPRQAHALDCPVQYKAASYIALENDSSARRSMGILCRIERFRWQRQRYETWVFRNDKSYTVKTSLGVGDQIISDGSTETEALREPWRMCQSRYWRDNCG